MTDIAREKEARVKMVVFFLEDAITSPFASSQLLVRGEERVESRQPPFLGDHVSHLSPPSPSFATCYFYGR